MLRTAVLISAFVVCALAQADIDRSFCDPDNLRPNPNLPNIPLNISKPVDLQYEMLMEVNDGLRRTTIEMNQLYDGPGNRAVVFFRSNGVEIRFYMYGNTNERITVIPGEICVVEQANNTLSTPIPAVNIGGFEHIVPPLALLHLLNPTQKEVYIGTGHTRGIPVQSWRMCGFDGDTQAFQKITFNMSDPENWSLAYPGQSNIKSVLVGMTIESKLRSNGTTWKTEYMISQYRARDLSKEEKWVTPNGLYCSNRAQGKPLPKIPEVFTFRAEVVSPLPELKDMVGTFTNIREIFDTKNKLFRFDYVSDSEPISEVHDFNTGIKYTFDRYKGTCNTSKIDPNGVDAVKDGQFARMRNPQEFFNFDAEFQYVGQKRVGHVDTDVWIGQRDVGKLDTTWEYHFMTDGWYQNSKLQAQAHEPVLLIVTFYQPYRDPVTKGMGVKKVPVYYYFYDFDESGLDVFQFGVSQCYPDSQKRRFKFTIPSRNKDLMMQYTTNLKLGILIGLVPNLEVLPNRITDIDIDFTANDVNIFVTVLEKPSTYYVEKAPKENSLKAAAEKLEKYIKDGRFVIPFIVDNKKFDDFIAYNDSFQEIQLRVSKEKVKNIFTSGELAGVIIGVLVLGMLVGILAGVFFCIIRPNAIKFEKLDAVIGFVNPGFGKKGEA